VVGLGGSFWGVLGLGVVLRGLVVCSRSAAEIALMRGVRKVFDPHGILNPGKLFVAD
jgi:FAD/FMN-containing dehydrogenase